MSEIASILPQTQSIKAAANSDNLIVEKSSEKKKIESPSTNIHIAPPDVSTKDRSQATAESRQTSDRSFIQQHNGDQENRKRDSSYQASAENKTNFSNAGNKPAGNFITHAQQRYKTPVNSGSLPSRSFIESKNDVPVNPAYKKAKEEERTAHFMQAELAEGTANGKVEAKQKKGEPVVLVPKTKLVEKQPAIGKNKSKHLKPEEIGDKKNPVQKKLPGQHNITGKNKGTETADKDADLPVGDVEKKKEKSKDAEPQVSLQPLRVPAPEAIDKRLPGEVQQFLQNYYTVRAEAAAKRNLLAENIFLQKVRIAQQQQFEQNAVSEAKASREKEITKYLKQSLTSANAQLAGRNKTILSDAFANQHHIEEENEKNITAINKTATDSAAQLQTEIENRKKGFTAYVEEQKLQPSKIAASEADLADKELEAASAEAVKTGEDQAAKFGDSDQKEASREVAAGAAKEINDKKAGIREEAMNKASEFNGNYDEYTQDVMTQLDNAFTGLSGEIDKSKTGLLQKNAEAFTKAKTDIENGRKASEDVLTTAHKHTLSTLYSSVAAAKRKLEKDDEQAKENLATISHTLSEAIDTNIVNEINSVDSQVTANPDNALRQLVKLAAGLEQVSNAAGSGLANITTATVDTFEKNTSSFKEQSEKVSHGFSSSAGQVFTGHKKASDGIVKKFSTDSASAISDMAASNAGMLTNAFTEIDKQINERKGKIAKVNERFAADLKPAIGESVTEAKKPLTDPLWSRCFEAGEKAGESWWQGVLDAIGSIVKGLLIVVALAALLVVIVAALGGTLGFMAAMLIVGVVMLSVAAIASFINRRSQGFGIAASLGLAVTDAFGLTGLWEAGTGKEVGTGKKLSTYERSKRGTEGALSLALIVAGVRGSRGGGAASAAAEGAEAGRGGGLMSGLSKFLPEGLKSKFASAGEAAEFFKGKGAAVEEGLQSLGSKLGKSLGSDKAIPNLNESAFGQAMAERFSWWPKTAEVKPTEIKPTLDTGEPDQSKTGEEKKPDGEEKKPDGEEKKPDGEEKKPDGEEKKPDGEEKKPGKKKKKPDLEEKKPKGEPTKDPKDLSIEELAKEGVKKPRPNESQAEANERVNAAKAEAIRRGYCFTAGTIVQTSKGPRRIETLASGETVLAMQKDDSIKSSLIIECILHSTSILYHVEIENSQKLAATGNHPFFIPGMGWRKAKDLQIGDPLLSMDSKIVYVTELRREFLLEPVNTFNLHVEETNNYYAGDSVAILVHNGTPVGDPVLNTKLIWGLGSSGPRQRLPSPAKDLTSTDPKLNRPFEGDLDGASGWTTNSTDDVGRFLGARNTEGGNGNHGSITEAQLESQGLIAVETPGTGAAAEAGFKHVSIRPANNPDPNTNLTDAEMVEVKAKLEILKPVAANKPADFLC